MDAVRPPRDIGRRGPTARRRKSLATARRTEDSGVRMPSTELPVSYTVLISDYSGNNLLRRPAPRGGVDGRVGSGQRWSANSDDQRARDSHHGLVIAAARRRESAARWNAPLVAVCPLQRPLAVASLPTGPRSHDPARPQGARATARNTPNAASTT